jgi:hypothetical protein
MRKNTLLRVLIGVVNRGNLHRFLIHIPTLPIV